MPEAPDEVPAGYAPTLAGFASVPLAERQAGWRRRCEGRLLACASLAVAAAAGACVVVADLSGDVPLLLRGLALAVALASVAVALERWPARAVALPPPTRRGGRSSGTGLGGARRCCLLRAGLSCAEAAAALGRCLAFLAMACHLRSLRPNDTVVAALVVASRLCISLAALASAVLGGLIARLCGRLPSVFMDDGQGHAGNTVSVHLLALGAAVGTLGVGVRGLQWGDQNLDECFFSGVCAPAKILAAFALDAPHIVLGSILLASSPVGDWGAAEVLGVCVVAAGAMGVLLAAKAFWIDLRWFWYGTEHKQRLAYLRQRDIASARWSLMNRNLKKLKHEARLQREARTGELAES